MTIALVQSAYAGNSGADTGGSPVSLASAPTAGNLLLIWCGQRGLASSTLNVPSGWTVLGYADHTGGAESKGHQLIGKISAGTETTVTFDNNSPAGGAPESAIYAEFSGFGGDLPTVEDLAAVEFTNDDTPALGTLVVADGYEYLLVASQWKKSSGPNPGPATVASHTIAGDSEYAAFGNRHRLTAWYRYIAVAGASYSPGDISSSGDATDDGTTLYIALRTSYVPPEPEPEPPYEVPPPAGPVLEIWTADPESDRWDDIGWGSLAWATAGWQDVTPQGVTADISWGAQDPAAGILAIVQGGLWTIQTYDPDRKLDPSNDASPFYPEIVPGLPIRINHRSVELRRGIVETIDYEFADTIGRIRASDAVLALQATVPEDSILSDTVYGRAHDAIAAAGVDVPLIWDAYNATVSSQPDGELTAWDHIRNVAQERPRVIWITREGALRFRRWGTPLTRGRILAAPNLTNLRVTADDSDRYSVVRALDEDGVTTVERAVTPTPRYGRRVYSRTRTTIDSDDWAAMILDDRATPGLVYQPGDVACFDADDVEYFGTIEGGELVAIDTDEIAGQDGIVLGGRLRVLHRGGDLPVWRWTFAVARTGSSSLVHDITGAPLVDDGDTDLYLIAD